MATFDYGEAIKTLIEYWKKYHVDYQSLRSRYWSSINQKKQCGYLLHNKNDGPIIRGFPDDIELLEKQNESDAVDFIDDMNPTQLKNTIFQIEEEIASDCCNFSLLKKKVRFHEQDLKDQARPSKYLYNV